MDTLKRKRDKALLAQLLDENRPDEPVVLYNTNDCPVPFWHLATIPYAAAGRAEKTFVVLCPVEDFGSLRADEAAIFRIDKDAEGYDAIYIEEDEQTIEQVYARYSILAAQQE